MVGLHRQQQLVAMSSQDHAKSESNASYEEKLPCNVIKKVTADFASMSMNSDKTKKTRHTSEPTPTLDSPSVFQYDLQEQDQQSFLIGQSVFNQIMTMLPSMIEHHLSQHSCHESKEIKTNEKYEKELEKVKKYQKELISKLKGYNKQTEGWIEKSKKLQTKVDELQQKTESNVNWQSTANDVIKANTEGIQNLKQQLQSEIENKSEKREKIDDVVSSQEFVTNKYDDIEKEQNELKNDVKELKKKIENHENKIQTQEGKIHKQEIKTEHIFTYSRQDHVCFSGVPICRGPDGMENCKQMVINICRELHYNIPPNEISTAHRLKQHSDRTGPPGIIVRFKDRDIRKDVLRLNRQTRDKDYWYSYGIRRLYINEQLTPDKRKLMYETKVLTRELYNKHGKIFVWTYKGDIFIRKGVMYAPKRKITCMENLNDIKSGSLSLEPVRNLPNRRSNTSISNGNPETAVRQYPLVAAFD